MGQTRHRLCRQRADEQHLRSRHDDFPQMHRHTYPRQRRHGTRTAAPNEDARNLRHQGQLGRAVECGHKEDDTPLLVPGTHHYLHPAADLPGPLRRPPRRRPRTDPRPRRWLKKIKKYRPTLAAAQACRRQ